MSDELIINSDNVVHNFHNQTHNLYSSTLRGYLFLDLSVTSIPLRVIGYSPTIVLSNDKKKMGPRGGESQNSRPIPARGQKLKSIKNSRAVCLYLFVNDWSASFSPFASSTNERKNKGKYPRCQRCMTPVHILEHLELVNVRQRIVYRRSKFEIVEKFRAGVPIPTHVAANSIPRAVTSTQVGSNFIGTWFHIRHAYTKLNILSFVGSRWTLNQN